jgi:uncharacterized membrane protein
VEVFGQEEAGAVEIAAFRAVAVSPAGEAVSVVAEREEVGDLRRWCKAMKARTFLNQLQHDAIVTAIKAAEKKTSGEIRVLITRKEVVEPVKTAQTHFIEMGMQNTRERNGVLLFIAPRSHQFAVVGDTAVHARCGEEFWSRLTSEMSGYFRKSEFTQGIVHGVRMAGDLLAAHFPCPPDDRNELPDEVERD